MKIKQNNKIKNKKALHRHERLVEETWRLYKQSCEILKRLEFNDKHSYETDIRLDKTDNMFKETDKKIAEFIEQSKINDEHANKKIEEIGKLVGSIGKNNEYTNKKFEEIGKLVGNIGRNNGAVAEEFFYNGLSESKCIGDLEFDLAYRNIHGAAKKLEDEFDIVLVNSSSVAIIEVKYKVHPYDVLKLFEKKIPNYKILFPLTANYKIYGVIAGLSVPDDVRTLAAEYGFIVLTQAGNDIKIIQHERKAY